LEAINDRKSELNQGRAPPQLITHQFKNEAHRSAVLAMRKRRFLEHELIQAAKRLALASPDDTELAKMRHASALRSYCNHEQKMSAATKKPS
jgi:hypothetical protein